MRLVVIFYISHCEISPSASRHPAEGFERLEDPMSSMLEIFVWRCVIQRLQLSQLLLHPGKPLWFHRPK